MSGYVDCDHCEVPVLDGETIGVNDGFEFCSTRCVSEWLHKTQRSGMSEPDFKAACDLMREECAKMTDHQIAILIGLIVHDQDERVAKKDTR